MTRRRLPWTLLTRRAIVAAANCRDSHYQNHEPCPPALPVTPRTSQAGDRTARHVDLAGKRVSDSEHCSGHERKAQPRVHPTHNDSASCGVKPTEVSTRSARIVGCSPTQTNHVKQIRATTPRSWYRNRVVQAASRIDWDHA